MPVLEREGMAGESVQGLYVSTYWWVFLHKHEMRVCICVNTDIYISYIVPYFGTHTHPIFCGLGESAG